MNPSRPKWPDSLLWAMAPNVDSGDVDMDLWGTDPAGVPEVEAAAASGFLGVQAPLRVAVVAAVAVAGVAVAAAAAAAAQMTLYWKALAPMRMKPMWQSRLLWASAVEGGLACGENLAYWMDIAAVVVVVVAAALCRTVAAAAD